MKIDVLKVTQMEKILKWVFKTNPKHFFKIKSSTNTWDEIKNNEIDRSFKFQTYISDKIILHNEELNQYVELSDRKARIVLGSIEYLDYDYAEEYLGNWVLLDGNERKTKKNLFFRSKRLNIFY